MLLKTLLSSINFEYESCEKITDLSVQSKKCTPGCAFIAIAGDTSHGLNFWNEARQNGATICLLDSTSKYAKKLLSEQIILIPNLKKLLPKLVKFFYQDYLDKISIIGITGTNGKTSTAYFIWQILNQNNINTAYLGTLGLIHDKLHVNTDITTPDICLLHRLIADLVKKNVKFLALEVSSHAIKQNRLGYLKFHTKILTNITHDHLDYHVSFQEYANIKLSFFNDPESNNITFLEVKDKFKIISKKNYNIIERKDYNITNKGLSSIDVTYNDFNIKSDNLIGDFMGENLVLALAAIKNILPNAIVKDLKAPPGRMECWTHKQKKIIVDFAHTPDAINRALKTLRPFVNSLTVIFGCGGDRDTQKRCQIGKLVAQYADKIIISLDNPRTESPEIILKDITKFLHKKDYNYIPNRERAIQFALNDLSYNECVIIFGKGHETWQIIGNKKVYHSDRKICQIWKQNMESSCIE